MCVACSLSFFSGPIRLSKVASRIRQSSPVIGTAHDIVGRRMYLRWSFYKLFSSLAPKSEFLCSIAMVVDDKKKGQDLGQGYPVAARGAQGRGGKKNGNACREGFSLHGN